MRGCTLFNNREMPGYGYNVGRTMVTNNLPRETNPAYFPRPFSAYYYHYYTWIISATLSDYNIILCSYNTAYIIVPCPNRSNINNMSLYRWFVSSILLYEKSEETCSAIFFFFFLPSSVGI